MNHGPSIGAGPRNHGKGGAQPPALRQQLIVIILIITAFALILTSIIMVTAALSSFRQGLLRDIAIKAEILGDQCSAALLFNAPREAEAILGLLRADEQIEVAAVYTRTGALFAAYRRDGAVALPPAAPPPEGHVFTVHHLTLLHPIVLDNERIGVILVRSDLGNLHALLRRHGAAAVLVLPTALLIAYILASRLQRRITRPVANLVEVMEHITRDKDLAVRAGKEGPEELRSLADGLNEMLETIGDRDQELARQRVHLESTVERLERSTRELQEANRKLKTLDKLKSDFVSTVSHELRTPLTAIKAFVELVLMKPAMEPERKLRLLRTIDEESDRLGRLISDLLDLSRIEAGTMQWRFEELDLGEIVGTSVEKMLPLSRNKRQRLSLALRTELPPLRGDRDRLVQVVTNILSNAVKFTPHGGSIDVSVRREGTPRQQIVVEVRDSGSGIPSEDLELIFDKFHRAGDPLTSGIEGTGLGLSISRQIIEHHGGRIWAVNNNSGGGSTFFFTLPLS